MAWSSYAIQTLVSCLAGSPRSGLYDTHGSRGSGSCAQVASSSSPSIRGGVVARVACSSGVATAWAFADPANCEETSSASTSRIQVRSCTLALRFGVPNGFTEMNTGSKVKGYNPRHMRRNCRNGGSDGDGSVRLQPRVGSVRLQPDLKIF